jgi:uncharacterized protein involved in type VI secretion and phage assembly
MPRYADFVTLEIDGKPAPDSLYEDILQVSVEESLHLPGLFTLVINNDYFPGSDQEATWKYDELLAIGKPIKLSFQASTTLAEEYREGGQGSLLEGEITGIEAQFTGESQAPVVVRGYDVAHRLHRGRYRRSFQNMTDSDIVRKVIGEVGIQPGTIESTGGPHDYVFQENQTNMEFLRERAALLGFELYVRDRKLHFRKPTSEQSVELRWLTNLHSFRVRMTSAEQVSEVEVRAWDYTRKEPIVATASNAQLITELKQPQKGRDTNGKFRNLPSPKLTVVDHPVAQAQQASAIATSLCNELGGEFIQADAKSEGNPDLRPGRAVSLKGLGRYDGQYYITETRHLYHKRVYTTEFSIRGLRGGNLLTLLTPAKRLKPGQTLLIGIVTDNKDPQGWGRVKVKFPTLTEDHASNWARVVAIGAGSQRGFDCLPEINDEVLVAFEHGDIHRPYILGGLWNGQDATAEKVSDNVADGKVRLRTFQSRVGHKLQLVDEDKASSKKGAYLKTTGGHHLRLNDSDRCIEIETSGGHKIRLDDKNQCIEIKTSGGHEYTMSDRTASIRLKSTGSLSLQANTTLDLKANGIVTVQGKLIKLN